MQDSRLWRRKRVPNFWHLSLKKVGRAVDAQQLAEVIAEKSSLTPGDVHNVIRNLMTVMRSQLLNSRTVRLDGLGTFTMRPVREVREWSNLKT